MTNWTSTIDLDPSVDPELAALCDDAAGWLMTATASAAVLGIPLPEGIARMLGRVHTGYMPEPQRRNVKHRALRDGLRTRKLARYPYAGIKAKARSLGFEVRA